eukprot:m.146947 g.146947  ORF g.146947 m.146947 type:complete len:215 (-) comp16099_c0_seq2:1-645(-)
MRVNVFSICDDDGNPIAAALYDKLWAFNHSCEPNCVVTFSGALARARTLRNIAVDQELTISYIDLCQPQIKRRFQLQEQYKFTCRCPRCCREEENDPVMVVQCPEQSCTAPMHYQLTDPVDDASAVFRTCPRGHRVPVGDDTSAWESTVSATLRHSAEALQRGDVPGRLSTRKQKQKKETKAIEKESEKQKNEGNESKREGKKQKEGTDRWIDR